MLISGTGRTIYSKLAGAADWLGLTPRRQPKTLFSVSAAPAHPCARGISASLHVTFGDDARPGRRPRTRVTFVSAKVTKAICAWGLRPQPQRVPSWPRSPPRVPEGTVPVPAGGVRLAALRFPCSRWQVQGSPSVASPFSGTIHALRSPCFAVAPAQAVPGLWAFGGVKVHRTFTWYRLTHWTFALIRFTPLAPLRAGRRLGRLSARRKAQNTLTLGAALARDPSSTGAARKPAGAGRRIRPG